MADATAGFSSDPHRRVGATALLSGIQGGVPFCEGIQHAAAGGANWSTMQLEPGEFRVDVTSFEIHGMTLTAAQLDRTSLHRVRTPAGSVSLLMRSGSAGVLFLAGREITPHRYARIVSATEFELIAHAGTTVLMVSLRDSPDESADSPLRENRSDSPASIEIIEVGERLLTLNEPISTALNAPSSPASPASRVAVSIARQHAMALLQRPVNIDNHPQNTTHGRLERRRRRAAVELARQYVRDHMSERIQLADLCSCTHLQARSLEYGFQEVVRLSPMRYVRMLRLGEVRRQLIECQRPLRSISEIALDAGFTHLSQFAVDYRKVFDETPSATRRRVLAGLLPLERLARLPERNHGSMQFTSSADRVASRRQQRLNYSYGV